MICDGCTRKSACESASANVVALKVAAALCRRTTKWIRGLCIPPGDKGGISGGGDAGGGGECSRGPPANANRNMMKSLCHLYANVHSGYALGAGTEAVWWPNLQSAQSVP